MPHQLSMIKTGTSRGKCGKGFAQEKLASGGGILEKGSVFTYTVISHNALVEKYPSRLNSKLDLLLKKHAV